jgi:excisionase family DNA binding protein
LNAEAQSNDSIAAVMTVPEAHRALGTTAMTLQTFYRAVRRNEVPHIRLGGKILIPRAAFLKLLSA